MLLVPASWSAWFLSFACWAGSRCFPRAIILGTGDQGGGVAAVTEEPAMNF